MTATAPPRLRPTHDDASAPAESVRLIDRPASGHGRTVLVEPHMEHDDRKALQPLLDDCIEQAQRHDQVPMLQCPVESQITSCKRSPDPRRSKLVSR